MHHEIECGCGQHGHGERPGMDYGHGGFMQRHFISKEEIMTKLQEYLNQLQAEAKGVEEHIGALKKES